MMQAVQGVLSNERRLASFLEGFQIVSFEREGEPGVKAVLEAIEALASKLEILVDTLYQLESMLERPVE